MSASPAEVTAVRWGDLCPWLLLVRGARVALFVRVIVLAAAGVLLTEWGWSALEAALLPAEGVAPLGRLTERPAPLPWQTSPPAADAGWQPFDAVDGRGWSGPLVRGWAWAIQPLTRLGAAESFGAGVLYTLAGVWTMAVWSLFGGAIARIAAVHLTRRDLLGPAAALQSGVRWWPSTMSAPSFCFGVIAIFVALLVVGGLVLRLGLLAFLASLAWPLALCVGLGIAAFALGLLIGWPLMWSAVAVERTDAFDAVSRGYAFAYQRPLHLTFFLLVATVVGVLAQALVTLVAEGALLAVEQAIALGAGPAYAAALLGKTVPGEGEALGLLAGSAGNIMQFWTAGYLALARAFPLAYLFPVAVAMYLLLRQLIDSTELAEVTLDGEELPAPPPLVPDPATGVPTLAAGDDAVPNVPPNGATAADAPSATVSELRGGST
ncbi:MAG TPA: hypothetical protein PKC18_11800 [Lacipirellulaceae bacterium]|nr:hypothetical protein [Lacipirellulaceae bacterium]